MEKFNNVCILGSGLVGGPMALDLIEEENINVTVADISKENLNLLKNNKINKVVADLSVTDNVRKVIQDQDLVINAMPGFLGFKTMKTIIESKKNLVDISFLPEDHMDLNQLATDNQVTAIVDMGVAPGMSNLLTGYLVSILDKVLQVDIYVGGLPKTRILPWEYKAVFSPADVIEEYTRPARVMRGGKIKVLPPLSETELIDIQGLGTLEAFNSDGLRSLLFTIPAPEMSEKTLRYPGYAKKISLLKECGFFSTNEIILNGNPIKPLDLTTKLLFPLWELQKGEEDITVMKIMVTGTQEGYTVTHTYDLFDHFDPEHSIHSMARTTGYAATTAALAILQGKVSKKGVILPEVLGEDKKLTDFFLNRLAGKNINYRFHTVQQNK